MAPTLRQESQNAHKTVKVSNERFEIFQKWLESSNSESEERKAAEAAAARSIDGLAPTGNKEDADNFIWQTWGDVFQIAQQIPHASPAQDSLAQILVQLTQLPDTDRKIDWTDLPQLGWVLRDWFNFTPSEKHANGADEILSAWVNVNAFWARLGGLECLNTVDITIWTLRRTLEEDHDDDATNFPNVFDCHVLTAAQYVEQSGPKLKKLIQDGWKPQDNEAQMFQGGPLFDGPTGLTKERWQFWASRFRHTAEKASGNDAKSAATRAAEFLEQ
ncbi:hypothetical protein PFICI_03439 [Pestalotiopsis fici W106-1]|uniref:Uncharacterized protein n=1 Tax=Pestalotiopsis fici (strain W106-1 / CGMCC3.15140) TaxID=1229662 RepID=W3XHE6_PESFW|nr:uncharacterized protein PFICI_03439 [Pestalotiopsis fici W106-1]ETS85414.1 hypothetical protein PFICI_03439 [Pestalotiopsis fici W106-1]